MKLSSDSSRFTSVFESPESTLLNIALAAAAAGLSVVPPRMDGSKAPLDSWKSFQHFPPDEARLRRWYANPALTGIGLITGAVSGNLECLEFDDRLAYESFKSAADAAGLGELVARIEAGYLEQSPKPGIHWLYRCPEIAGNTKLATRPKAPEEMKHPKDREQVLIETRGEGGYVITAPSNGKTHPSGGCYALLSGGFDSIAQITPEERRDLFTLARTFHVAPAAESVRAERENVRAHRTEAPVRNGAGWRIRPGDDFNAKADWRELLEAQGWTFVFRQGERDYWRRPGKGQGVSACTNWEGRDYFYCFSTSTEFEAEKPIDKFGFHAKTCHGGDFKATVKALTEAGYGTPEPGAARPAKPNTDTKAGSAKDDAVVADDEERPITEAEAIHPDYCASQGGTFWIKHNEDGDKFVFLANFRAEILSETRVDDGAVSTRRLEIAGTLAGGERLPLATCASGHFAQLNWVGEHWGTAAQIAPGIGLKDRLRYAIQVLSVNVQRRSVFAHTGWREVGNQWLYLSAGVCIGNAGAVAGIDMELPASLADYELVLSAHPAAAIYASLELLNVAAPSISTPLFLAPYRAILSEALPVDFSLFLTGTTGSRKTELAALVQAHFGSRWHGKHLPAAWSSTANRLEQDAFRAKDAVLVVDDFCPGGATHDVARIHKEADRLLRAQGNRAGRGRMNADGSPRPAYYPRGLIVATGEDVPRGQSLRGRLLVLEFAPDTVNLVALTAMQQHAGAGRLAAAAGAFCQWLAALLPELKKTLPARFRQKRAELMGAGAHSRHPDTLAELILTAEVFAQFAADAGVSLPMNWLETLADALLQAGKEQAQFIATEEPAGRFVRLISAALAAGLCHVKRKDGREPYSTEKEMTGLGWQLKTFGCGEAERTDWYAQGPAIGWFEEHHLYLEPDAAYRTAAKFADEQGQALPLTQRSLFKAMESKGLIRSKQPGRTTTVIKHPDKTTSRVLHISRVYGENSGNFGNSGNQSQQSYDSQEEKTVTDSEKAESLSVTSVTNVDPVTDNRPRLPVWLPEENPIGNQKSPINPLSDIEKNAAVTEVTEVTAFPPPLPPQSFSGEHPAPDSPLTRTILTTLAGRPAGMERDELERTVNRTHPKAGALVANTINDLLLGRRISKINGRLVAATEVTV